MPYAVVQDIAASWERYKPLAGAIAEPAPAGLILYAAGPTDEGIRIIAVWEDERAWDAFHSPKDLALSLAIEAPARSVPILRHLQAQQFVLGAWAVEHGRGRGAGRREREKGGRR